MALHLDVQGTPGGSYTEIDLEAEHISGFVVSTDYSAPRSLRFSIHQPSHSLPIALRSFMRFWDDTYFSSGSPLFEGFIWDVQCDSGDANLIHYTAYDPTHMVGREVPVMSAAWEAGPPIAYAATAVPRLVLNCYVDSDTDYAYQRDTDVSVGGAIAGILDDALPVLRYWNAAPSGTAAYTTDVDDLTYQPQDKLVFEGTKITQAVQELLSHYPARRLVWIPGDRKWRLVDLTTADTNTITLNKISGTDIVLGCDLRRTLDGCCTAVRIFGPESTVTTAYATGDGSLTTVSTVYAETYTDGTGDHDVYLPYEWQITDSDARRGARRLEADVYAPMGSYNWVRTRSPNLQLSWDGGTTWITILNPLIDFNHGLVSTGIPLFFWADPPPVYGSTQQFFGPTHAKLIWGAFDAPLSVRAPTEGFEGTAYTVAGMTCEEMKYDPSLAAGYEWGQPVLTATRESQFQAMAQAILDERKDIRYTGVIILTGMHYDYSSLNRRVNIAAHDADGAPLTTGWEEIGAQVTGVEYDFEAEQTTLTINGDQLDLLGEDPQEMKRKLGIKNLVQGFSTEMKLVYSMMNLTYSPVAQLPVVSGHEQQSKFSYYDPDTGEQQA